MESLVPTSRLSSVDFPALDRPTRDTNPVFMASTDSGSRFGRLGRFRNRLLADPHSIDAAPLGVEHFDREAVDVELLPDVRDAADVVHQEATHGLEAFALDLDVEPLRHLVDVHLAAEDDAAVAFVDDRLRLDVVLVANLADDLLEQVLDGHQARRAAVLVDDDRDLRLLPLK